MPKILGAKAVPNLPPPPADMAHLDRADRDLSKLAPRFEEAVRSVLMDMVYEGHRAIVVEALRSDERQAHLFNFGRSYDDGRGVVTMARVGDKSWHRYGLAVDIAENDKDPWVAPEAFWLALQRLARKHGLASGMDWLKKDRPHVQWGKCPKSPSTADMIRFRQDGFQGVWKRYNAH